MKNCLLFCLSILSSLCLGQGNLPIQYDTTLLQNELSIIGNGEFGATSIQNQLLNKLIFGGTITDQIKTQSFNKQIGLNYAGCDINSEIIYNHVHSSLFKNENIGWSVKTGYQSLLSSTYSKDAFGLLFLGADSYIDNKADFSGLSVKINQFQKFGLGLFFKKSRSSIHLNYYNIKNHLNSYLFNGILYQFSDPNQDSLRLKGYWETPTNNQFNKGYGFGLDIDLKFKVDWGKDQQAIFQFQAKNLGYATVNSGVNYYAIDTTYHITGFQFTDIANQNGKFTDSSSITEIANVQHSIHKTNFFLPAYFQIGKIIDENFAKPLQSYFGIRMFPTQAYIPQVYVGFQYKIGNKLSIALQESYGGFNRLRTGFYTNFQTKKFAIGLGSENLIGCITQKGYGQALNFRIKCAI